MPTHSVPEGPGFTLRTSDGADQGELLLSGRLTLRDAGPLWEELQSRARPLGAGDSLHFDLSEVTVVDGGAMALLVHLRSDLQLRGVQCEFQKASERVSALVHLYRGDIDPKRRKERKPPRALEQIGRATIAFFLEIQLVLGFLGTSVLAAVGLLKEPRTANWREVLPIMERAGVDAVPIVVLINFLVGFVMAFQGAVQLKQFGADIFVADLVGLSVTRELGPLMTTLTADLVEFEEVRGGAPGVHLRVTFALHDERAVYDEGSVAVDRTLAPGESKTQPERAAAAFGEALHDVVTQIVDRTLADIAALPPTPP